MSRSILDKILSEPAAPFREGLIRMQVEAILSSKSVPHFQDPHGNLIVGAKSRADYLKKLNKRSKPLFVYIAHMDHPGFHLTTQKKGRKWQFKWFGGSPLKYLENAKVWLADSNGYLGEGKLSGVKLHKSKRFIESGWVKPMEKTLRRPLPQQITSVFGSFGYTTPKRKGSIIYTKAADDLAGVYCIVQTALDLWSKKLPGRDQFLGLLTRGEEVGFVGAIEHFQLGWLTKARRQLIGVSLEASRALPGAEIGKGPILRLGDRVTVFDANSLAVFSGLAQKLLPGKHQRRIMDGGACEATAATAFGIPCIGISVPLGNYHNQTFEGAPDSRGKNGPASEFVHQKDLDGMLRLCRGLVTEKLDWSTPWKPIIKRLSKNAHAYRAEMRFS